MNKNGILTNKEFLYSFENFHIRKFAKSDLPGFLTLFEEEDINYFYTRDRAYQNDIRRMFFDNLGDESAFTDLFIGIFVNNEIAGFCYTTFHKEKYIFSNLSYALSSKFRGVGIMTKTLTKIIEIIELLNFDYIEAIVDTQNKSSEAVLKRTGFKNTMSLAFNMNLDEGYSDRSFFIWEKHLITEQKLIEMGVEEYRNRKYLNAVEIFTKLINRSNIAIGYNNRAAAYVLLNRFSDALEDYLKAKELGFSDPSLENNIRLTKQKLGY